ncbi:NADase-type glycan-binding domain-containing protein [Clostridium sp. DL1XJH146]
MSKKNYKDQKNTYTENGAEIVYKEGYDFSPNNNKGNNKVPKMPKEPNKNKKDKPKKKKSKLAIIATAIFITVRLIRLFDGFFDDDKVEVKEVINDTVISEQVEELEDTEDINTDLNEDMIDISDKIQTNSSEIIEVDNYWVPTSIEASSYEKSSEQNEFVPDNICDFDITTVWAEGVEGTGVGEWIELEFGSEINIKGIEIHYGNKKSEKEFNESNIPETVRVEFSGNRYIYMGKGDFYDYDSISILELDNVKTSFVRFVIIEASEGNKNDSTCISEINVF